jgi:hypothetical protein
MNWKHLTLIIAALALVVIGGGMAISATYSDFTSGDVTLSRSAIEPVHDYLPFIQYRKFDFGATGLNGGSGVTNGDVVKLFNVAANTYIEEFGYRVTTAAVKSGTSAEVGDTKDPDGYIGNDYDMSKHGIPFLDLSSTMTGVSFWNWIGTNFLKTGSGSSYFFLGGVSYVITESAGTAGLQTIVPYSNHGPYFTSNSGLSPYIGGDTINMTVYVDKTHAPGSGKNGVTPVFEAYIKGFRRVVP